MNGDIFTTEEWLRMVDEGILIDYDGYGEPLGFDHARTTARRVRTLLHPSMYRAEGRVGWLTRSLDLLGTYKYVVWYNR